MGSGENAAHYRLTCPRCSGDISYYENAGAVACPFCRARFFLGADASAGWLVVPRLRPEDSLQEARRWLRERKRRVTRIEEPRGFLLPMYWTRGKHVSWEVGKAFQSRSVEEVMTSSLSSDLSSSSDVWEPRFRIRAYAHSFPAHDLAGALPGAATRFQAQTLSLLDPDSLPDDYRIVAPTVSRPEVETKLAAWLEGRRRRESKGEDHREATRSAEHRLNLVGIPVIVVPFTFRDQDRGGVLVDGLSGRALGEVAGEDLERLPWGDDPDQLPPSFPQGEVSLLPLECGECGWELDLSERDRLHGCPNCGLYWEMAGDRRNRVKQWFLDRPAGSRDRWLPFWVFGPGGSDDRLPEDPVFLPAYQARHLESQLHLSVHLTKKPPGGPWLAHSLDIHTGATIGSAETEAWRWAVEGALSRETFASFVGFLRTDTESRSWGSPAGLVWIPFEPRGGDLVEPRTGATVRESGTRGWEIRRAA